MYELVENNREVLELFGNVTLKKGDNELDVSEAVIISEVVGKFNYLEDVKKYEMNHVTLSPLSNRVYSFISLHKNGEDVKDFELISLNDVGSYGKVRIRIDAEHYDPMATYTVDYIPLEYYKISTPLDVVDIEYYEGLINVVNRLLDENSRNSIDIRSILQYIPDGIVLESGRNENGTYIKFADGTLICTGEKSETVDVTSGPTDGLYTTSSNKLTPLPHNFIEKPIISLGNGNSNVDMFRVFSITTSTLWYNPAALTSRPGANYNLTYIAIGRWK